MVWAHKTSLTAPIFIEVHVSIQGYKWPDKTAVVDPQLR
jgi:hypothetical protein